MSDKLISANDMLQHTVLAGEIRNPYMNVVPAYFIEEAHAVDAVEVVKCKYCKHFTEGMAVGICRRDPQKPILPMEWDNFCKYSERREANEID